MKFATIKNLRIVGIYNRGETAERIVMLALKATNLARYAVIQTERNSDGGVSATNRFVYWFPDADIQQGHYVLLYSRKGVNKVQVDKVGDTLHIFHWGLQGSVWESGATPTLVHVSAITYKD